MGWLLHISDLHLSDVSDAELEDAKLDIELPENRLTRNKVLRRTLSTVKDVVGREGRPEVAVISGDLTTAARSDGFEKFSEMLSDFADVLPEDPERIVVVPGNHDVVWDEKPGTLERYSGFLDATRAERLTTPLLDKLDFEETSAGVELKPDALAYPRLVQTDDLLVVPINSSNWCGVIADDNSDKRWSQDEWETVLSPLEPALRDEALTELRRMRQYDMGRVSSQQFDALRKVLDDKGVPHDRGDDPTRVRIAVIHHQLLPISRSEELKPFEAIINLGAVRDTLRELGFQIVLHGHKHESGMYWDSGRPAGAPFGEPEKSMLVVAAPGKFDRDEPAMRTLHLGGDARARTLGVKTLLGVDSERKTPKLAPEEHVPLWRPDMGVEGAAGSVIAGPDFETVYSRLRAYFESEPTEPVRNLTCVIESAAGAGRFPDRYPDLGEGLGGQEWFDALVAWWQLEDPELVRKGVLPFNHGERIYTRFDDQVRRAANLLAVRPETTRGLIELISPTELRNAPDDFEHSRVPAFCFVQPVLDDSKLDCVGYFRKQEMEYWWPVNVAELAAIQGRLVAYLAEADVVVEPGRIVTVSAIAHSDPAMPRVAVPELDLAVEDPNRLVRMAAAVHFPDGDAAAEGLDDWRRMLDDLAEPSRSGALRTARAGPERLLAHLDSLSRFGGGAVADGVRAALDELAAQYEGKAEKITAPAKIKRVLDRIEKLRAALDDVSAS
jgi:predicted MPP superfamily phosphohydrolase